MELRAVRDVRGNCRLGAALLVARGPQRGCEPITAWETWCGDVQ